VGRACVHGSSVIPPWRQPPTSRSRRRDCSRGNAPAPGCSSIARMDRMERSVTVRTLHSLAHAAADSTGASSSFPGARRPARPPRRAWACSMHAWRAAHLAPGCSTASASRPRAPGPGRGARLWPLLRGRTEGQTERGLSTGRGSDRRESPPLWEF
jgi:hypothetical protein